jgi:Fe-S oxidoreductase
MKGDGKPVSFIEDCAVPLEHLAEYTERLTSVFEKHGTRGTWYAHASVGTLHVRPILDMRRDGAEKMRAIAEEACAMVKQYKGAYSGEHGDGLVRSEWIAPFFGPRLTACLSEIKSWLDPRGLMNPGKIVAPPKMDERTLFRFKPGYRTSAPVAALDWSEWGGFDKAVEMCNNNGHCRKFDAGTMCPSYRATMDEAHLTRGRANTLRLALSGQLGPGADQAVKDALDLCVSCKGCKRECPTGVDMARMKIEYLAHYKATHGYSLRDRAVAYLPRYAPWAGRLADLANLLTRAAKGPLGFSPHRELPRWRTDFFHDRTRASRGAGRAVVVFVDTFNRWFEPENARAAIRVLQAAGCKVHVAQPLAGGRPLCCGRTFLSAGMVEEARKEARRTLDALRPYAARDIPVIGLEPSCLFSFRDEYGVILPDAEPLARNALLFEEFLAREPGTLAFEASEREVLLHGHCHQKAFDAMPAVEKVLGMVPGLKVSTVQTSCCGMAGSFGYEAEHHPVSMKMAEASLLPAVRNSGNALVVADGTCWRHQIAHGAGREAMHVARVLDAALRRGEGG